MTKEQIYAEQLRALGIYDPAFEPEIKQLAQLERELTRAQKAWSQTAPSNGKPSFEDPHYEIIRTLRRDILQHRDALGLTPKALQRLRGKAADAPLNNGLEISRRLDALAERCRSYE